MNVQVNDTYVENENGLEVGPGEAHQNNGGPSGTSDKNEEIGRLQEQIKRLRAEFDNFRKRTQREWQTNRDRAAADVFKLILPALDNMEKAISHAAETAEQGTTFEAFREGITLIYEQLTTAAANEGLSQLEVLGKEYDPELAEAIGIVLSDDEENYVHTVVQPGWRFHREIIRPAKVLVTKKRSVGPETE